MSKKKKKNKQEGVILVRTIAVSSEEHEQIKKHLASLECDFSLLLNENCRAVKFDESYYGSCPWCGNEIYTIDVCPDCGGMIDFG